MKKNLVVTLSDEAYVDQAKALFSSLYWQAGWRGDYMLIAHNIPEKKLAWFKDRGILVKEFSDNVFGEAEFKKLHRESVKPTSPAHLEIVLNKFRLFTPEFRRWGNIVYLDNDVLVNASIDRLLEGCGFKAVVDGAHTLRQQFKATAENQGIYDALEAGYGFGEPAFNAGVFSFNTDLIDADTYGSLRRLFKKYYPASYY
ncbi:MAG: hypothetical protein GF334_13840, partial [Candidatus Altiarchaeales archaeon]|nr:hypothetical protein [Candidatus Altiarchaeales archaeon]